MRGLLTPAWPAAVPRNTTVLNSKVISVTVKPRLAPAHTLGIELPTCTT